jgi:uncharacterized protein YciI
VKPVICSLLLCVILMFGSTALFSATDGQQVVAAKTTFLLIYRAGPAWPPGKPVSELPLKEHGRYMLSLYVKGAMKFAGPLTDDAGGAVVLEVADESAAKAIVADDPAVKSGIFVPEMHPWKLVQWEKYVHKPAQQ